MISDDFVTIAFHGKSYVLAATETTVRDDGEKTLSLDVEDIETGDCWQGDFSASFLEGVTSRTGSFKSYTVLKRMLLSAMHATTGSVALDLLTYADLEAIKNRGAEGEPSSSAQSSTKRYLILTYEVDFDRVHYPLPLALVEAPTVAFLQRRERRLLREIHIFRELAGLSATPARLAEGSAPPDMDDKITQSRVGQSLRDSIAGMLRDIELLRSKLDDANAANAALQARFDQEAAAAAAVAANSSSSSSSNRGHAPVSSHGIRMNATVAELRDANDALRARVRELTLQLAAGAVNPHPSLLAGVSAQYEAGRAVLQQQQHPKLKMGPRGGAASVGRSPSSVSSSSRGGGLDSRDGSAGSSIMQRTDVRISSGTGGVGRGRRVITEVAPRAYSPFDGNPIINPSSSSMHHQRRAGPQHQQSNSPAFSSFSAGSSGSSPGRGSRIPASRGAGGSASSTPSRPAVHTLLRPQGAHNPDGSSSLRGATSALGVSSSHGVGGGGSLLSVSSSPVQYPHQQHRVSGGGGRGLYDRLSVSASSSRRGTPERVPAQTDAIHQQQQQRARGSSVAPSAAAGARSSPHSASSLQRSYSADRRSHITGTPERNNTARRNAMSTHSTGTPERDNSAVARRSEAARLAALAAVYTVRAPPLVQRSSGGVGLLSAGSRAAARPFSASSAPSTAAAAAARPFSASSAPSTAAAAAAAAVSLQSRPATSSGSISSSDTAAVAAVGGATAPLESAAAAAAAAAVSTAARQAPTSTLRSGHGAPAPAPLRIEVEVSPFDERGDSRSGISVDAVGAVLHRIERQQAGDQQRRLDEMTLRQQQTQQAVSRQQQQQQKGTIASVPRDAPSAASSSSSASRTNSPARHSSTSTGTGTGRTDSPARHSRKQQQQQRADGPVAALSDIDARLASLQQFIKAAKEGRAHVRVG